jgi:AdoMet-dependent rRNA methyltransferase SPB1
MPTHKKKVNRDKYYTLAKEQGYRSRAAFKLIQINKKHDFLSKAKVCIDLCAAPGGWCQVAAKTMPANSIVLGIDLLPIRPIRNVKTFVSDITTADCRAMVKRELQTWTVDVVLCDGAPNVGTAYVKDAFVQNELALAALKFATDHLGKGGTFCTKVYRSQDYNALVWVFKQLFEDVQAIKPSSSRSVSAEIFLLCLRYRCPTSLDPRLLDPAHVFRQDYGGADGTDGPANPTPSIFHKGYDAQKRHRSGYDSALGPTLRTIRSVVEFVDCSDPAQFLAECNEISFGVSKTAEAVTLEVGSPGAFEVGRLYLEHSTTTAEVKECCRDLKLLNKGDFKDLLKWRVGLRAFRAELEKASKESLDDGGGDDENVDDGDDEEAESKASQERGGLRDDDATESSIQEEIAARQLEVRMRVRREKKKLRRAAAKLRERKALGMDHNSFEVVQDESIFSLATLKSRAHLDRASKVSLDRVGFEAVEDDGIGDPDHDDGAFLHRRKRPSSEYADEDESDDVDRVSAEVESMLDESYTSYLKRRKGALTGTKAAKRAKKAVAVKASQMVSEDAEEWDGDQDAYVKLLTESKDGNSESSDDENEEDEGRKSFVAEARQAHPLILNVEPGAEAPSDQVARWFSDPIFNSVKRVPADDDHGRDRRKRGRSSSSSEETTVDMPLTDKDVRKLKRKKEMERKARSDERKQKRLGQQGLELVSRNDGIAAPSMKLGSGENEDADSGGGGGDDDEEMMAGLENMTFEERERMLRIRERIAAGVGMQRNSKVGDSRNDGGLEIVPASSSARMPARMDDRKYDSDHEDYDTDDDVTTLAIGTLMQRPSRAKKLVDASYNRFAWNDPSDLPEWFVDDETKHYRPQVPVPKPLMDQIKQRFEDLTSKPIKKVAEARARKRKRAAVKLKAAKKKAEALANDESMSEKEKLKAIGKAMNSATKKSAEADHHTKKLIVMTKAHGGKVENDTRWFLIAFILLNYWIRPAVH